MPEEEMPKVSVVIPVYKVESFMEKSARALLGQTLDRMEYIFIDDRSPDRSIEVLQRVLEEFPHRKEQVRIIRHDVNQGVGAARNHGVEACTGEYVIHCDPDDWPDPDMYEKMYLKARETDADFVYSSFYEELPGGEFEQWLAPECHSAVELLFTFSTYGFLWHKMFRREIACSPEVHVPDHIIYCEDTLRIAQYITRCKTFAPCPEVFYHYQKNPQSIVNMGLDTRKTQGLLDVEEVLENTMPEEFRKALLPFNGQVTIAVLATRHLTAAQYRARVRKYGFTIFRHHRFPMLQKCIFGFSVISYTAAGALWQFYKNVKKKVQ